MSTVTSPNDRSIKSLGEITLDVLCFDPGDTTGWAFFRDGTLNAFGEMSKSDLMDAITPNNEFGDIPLNNNTVVVCEDYRIRPAAKGMKYTPKWSRVPAARIIGIIEYFAHVNGFSVWFSDPSNKPQGYALMGKDYKKNTRGAHIFDAMAHGHYYFLKEHNAYRK